SRSSYISNQRRRWEQDSGYTSTIPGQMLDRLDVYSIDKASPEFFDAVLALCMEDIAREAATSTWHLPSLDDAVLDALPLLPMPREAMRSYSATTPVSTQFARPGTTSTRLPLPNGPP
ncbi:hypothetical protein, partial [Camelimonas fluminis]